MKKIHAEFLAEMMGTFFLVLIGVGSVATAIWLQGYFNLTAVVMSWAVAVFIGVYVSGSISGGHINPAVTISFALFNDFPWRKVGPYILAQFTGAFLAAIIIWYFYGAASEAFEAANGLVRGEPGSQLSMMGYATFAPNPIIVGTDAAAFARVSLVQWFVSEALFTGVFVFSIHFLTDANNKFAPQSNLVPVIIGLFVAAIIVLEVPTSMTALSPARDLAPRVIAWLNGWGDIAFPGPRGGWWIPAVSTTTGAIIAGAFYKYVYKKAFAAA